MTTKDLSASLRAFFAAKQKDFDCYHAGEDLLEVFHGAGLDEAQMPFWEAGKGQMWVCLYQGGDPWVRLREDGLGGAELDAQVGADLISGVEPSQAAQAVLDLLDEVENRRGYFDFMSCEYGGMLFRSPRETATAMIMENLHSDPDALAVTFDDFITEIEQVIGVSSYERGLLAEVWDDALERLSEELAEDDE